MEVFLNVCRCCLSPNTEVSLFDSKHLVQEKFRETTSIEVTVDDGLPQKLCNSCFSLLNSAYHFRTQCIKMDMELRSQLTALNEARASAESIEDQEADSTPNEIEVPIESLTPMKELQERIKQEPDSDDDCYYVVVIDDPKDDIKKEPEVAIKDAFDDSIDSFLSSQKVPDHVPATILENEEVEGNDWIVQGPQLKKELMAAAEDMDTIDNEHIETITANLDNVKDQNLIKILTSSDNDGNIILRSSDNVTYYPSGMEEESSQEEVIVYEEGESSQFQILSCDGELVIEYADESQIVLKPDDSSQQNPLMCSCGEQFEDVDALSTHQTTCQADSNLCNLCGKGFDSNEILTGHMLLHKTRGLFIMCPFCNQLIKRNSITQHIKYGHNNVKTKCKICGKSFANPTNLKRHMMIHSGIRQFECDICYKRFCQKITMQTHRMTHVDLFNCPQCDKVCESKADLEAHRDGLCPKTKVIQAREDLIKTVKQDIKNVDGELLGYACGLCKKMFSLESAFQAHIDNVHLKQDAQELFCPECGELKTSQKELASHLNQHKIGKMKNLKRFNCSICGKGCPSKAMLIMHERVHTDERPFQCNYCAAKFKTKTHLRTHQLTHTGEKKFGCSVCLKFFALKGNLVVHLRTHTGERPYVCNICNEAFIDSKYLKKHKTKTHSLANLPWNKY